MGECVHVFVCVEGIEVEGSKICDPLRKFLSHRTAMYPWPFIRNNDHLLNPPENGILVFEELRRVHKKFPLNLVHYRAF